MRFGFGGWNALREFDGTGTVAMSYLLGEHERKS
jgi:hypothetical protein